MKNSKFYFFEIFPIVILLNLLLSKVTYPQKKYYYLQKYELNQNNKDYINQEVLDNEQVEEGEDDDDRLTYTLITLDLGNLIHIFEDNNISFVDMLLLSKEDLIELQLEIFQRNRILNFSKLFTKYAKNYSIREISDFFTFNKQFIFNSSIYDKVLTNNMNIYQNDMNNSNFNINNNNNNNDRKKEMPYLADNNNINFISQTISNNILDINDSKTKLNNQTISQKLKEPNNKSQNINGGTRRNKTSNIPNIEEIQDSFQNKLYEFIKKNKPQNYQIYDNINKNIAKGNKNEKNIYNEINKNEEYEKIIEKIGMLESYEMNYDFYTRLNLIKNYINNKGDKITIEDIKNINNDIDPMIEIMKNQVGKKSEIIPKSLQYYNLNNNESNKRKNRIKVIMKK